VNELFLERIFTIPAALVADAKVLVRLLLCLSITEFWSTSIMRVAEGFQQYLLVRTLEFGKWLLRAGLVVTAVMGGWGLPGIGVAYLVAGIIMLVLSYGKVFSQNSGIRINAKYLDRGSFRQLFGFSIWIFLAKMFSFLSYKIDTIILGIFLPPTNIALYNIAFKVYEFLRFGFSLLSSTLVAVTAELGVLQERETMSRLYQKATKYTMLIMYPIMVFAYFHADLIIRFWMGEGYETSIILAKLFIISLLFVASISAGAEMMVGLNRVRDLVPTAGIASIINVIVSIALVREIGASGVVVGTVIGSFLMSLGYVHQMNKAFGTSMAVIWKGAISTPLSVLLSLVLVFVIVRPLMLADGVFVIASLCIFLFLFDKDDQLLLLAPFRSVIRKISDQ
jgi:O-antigen/teichoic acid export membrane protein